MGWKKWCSWDLSHMTKLTTMPIYGKNPLKIFSSGTEWQVTLKLGCSIGNGPYQVCSNDDSWLALMYFTSRSNSVTEAKHWILSTPELVLPSCKRSRKFKVGWVDGSMYVPQNIALFHQMFFCFGKLNNELRHIYRHTLSKLDGRVQQIPPKP